MAEKCPSCKATQTVLRGFRYNRKTKKQLHLCKNCGRKFTLDDGFFRMRFAEDEIMKAVGLYRKGYSLATVKKRLASEGVVVSRWTILKWSRKYKKS